MKEKPLPGDSVWVMAEGVEQGRAAVLVQWQPDDRAIVQYSDEAAGSHRAVNAASVRRRRDGAEAPAPPSDDPFDQLVAAIPKVAAALERRLRLAQESFEEKRKHLSEEKGQLRQTRGKLNRQVFLINKALAILTSTGPLKRASQPNWTPEQREAARQRMIGMNRKRGRSRP